jgi:hypothetical protein
LEKKEKSLEEEHASKVTLMKEQVADLKKNFDARCQEFKK